MGQKADYFCFDWTFFCKVSGFLGRFNVRYHSNVTHWFLLHLLLPFFFLNNKFNLAPRSLVFFWRFQHKIWVRDKQEVNFRATKPSEESSGPSCSKLDSAIHWIKGYQLRFPVDRFTRWAALSAVTVIWASLRFGHSHSQNPSDMGIICNPNPNPNR